MRAMHIRRPIPNHNRWPIAPTFASLLALSAAGCGSGGGPDGTSIDGSDIPLAPQVEEVYSVGVLEGEAWEMFARVRAVAFDSDGTLFILDSEAGHIVVVDPGGAYVRTISNQGEGPGELNGPVSMAILADGRVAVNQFMRGVQVFSREGEFIQEAAFSHETGGPGPRMYALSDHSLLSAGIGSLRALLGEGAEQPEGRPIDRFRLDGSKELYHMAWAAPSRGEESGAVESGNVQIRISGMEAFPLPLSMGVLSDDRVVLADTTGYRIKLLDASGVVSATLERPVMPVAVTEEIREAERERRREALAGGSGGGGLVGVSSISIVAGGAASGGGGSISPDMGAIREMIAGQVESLTFPDEIPVIGEVAVDWSDRIWVERSALGAEPGPIDIFTAAGQYLGTIPPDGLRIADAFGPDGLLAYIEEDELEIQRVRVVRLPADGALETTAGR